MLWEKQDYGWCNWLNVASLGHRLSPLTTSGGTSVSHSGQFGRRSPLGQYEDYNHNIEPLIKDKTFIKSKSLARGKKSASPVTSMQRPTRLQPMCNARAQTPSFNSSHKNSSALYNQPPEKAADQGGLIPCHYCGRSFVTERLEKHQSICCKTTRKQRKVFDSRKMRTQGTEAAKYIRPGTRKAPDPPKTNWRQKHSEYWQPHENLGQSWITTMKDLKSWCFKHSELRWLWKSFAIGGNKLWWHEFVNKLMEERHNSLSHP